MDIIYLYIILTMLALTALKAIVTRDLIVVTVVMGLFSLLSAIYYILADGVDVALTESAVGAGVSTLFFLVTAAIVGWDESSVSKSKYVYSFIFAAAFVAMVAYGLSDLPVLFDPSNQTNVYLAPDFAQGTAEIFEIPNVVTAVLGSYRGYDTMGETAVVFIAALGVSSILWSKKYDK